LLPQAPRVTDCFPPVYEQQKIVWTKRVDRETKTNNNRSICSQAERKGNGEGKEREMERGRNRA